MIDELERTVDKTPAQPIVIHGMADLTHASEVLTIQKAEKARIVEALEPWAQRLYRAHKFVTSKRAEFVSYYEPRIEAADRAIVDYHDEQERIAAEERKRILDEAAEEDRQRREAEEAALKKQMKGTRDLGRREEIESRIEEVRNAPAPSVATYVGGGIGKMTTSAGTISGVRKSWDVEIQDDELLKVAVCRRVVLEETIKLAQNLRAKARTKDGRNALDTMIQNLQARLQAAAIIPSNVLEVSEAKVRKNANDTNGRINWPGVAVFEKGKTQTRRSR